MSHFFAQVNIARMLLPLDHPQMADFVNSTARINAIAEKSPGFLWRWNEGDETSDTAKAFKDMEVSQSINRIYLPFRSCGHL
jgi:hypothetical protein